MCWFLLLPADVTDGYRWQLVDICHSVWQWVFFPIWMQKTQLYFLLQYCYILYPKYLRWCKSSYLLSQNTQYVNTFGLLTTTVDQKSCIITTSWKCSLHIKHQVYFLTSKVTKAQRLTLIPYIRLLCPYLKIIPLTESSLSLIKWLWFIGVIASYN